MQIAEDQIDRQGGCNATSHATPCKPKAVLLLICVLFLAILAATLTLSYQEFNHTFNNNGKWQSTKSGLGISVMGAISFLYGRQPLENNQLNLGSWHGYHEVIYNDSIEATDAYFDFKLEDGAHISFIFGKTDNGFHSFVFSKNKNFQSGYYSADAFGKFVHKENIKDINIFDAEWNSAHIFSRKDSIVVELNGKKIFSSIHSPALINGKIGFRGGLKNSHVDNIKIFHKNRVVLKEDFFNTKNIVFVYLLIFIVLLIISAVIAFVVFNLFRARGVYLFFYLMMIYIPAMAYSVSLLIYIRNETGIYKSVDNYDLIKEAHYKSLNANDAQDRVVKSTSDKNAYRILFMGSSQTFGSGASSEDSTVSRVLCRNLNEKYRENKKYQCTNAGMSGVTVFAIRDLYKNDWSDKKFDLVILNVSSNDASNNIDNNEFRAVIYDIADVSQKKNIPLIFVLEANSIESDAENLHGLLSKHEVMKGVASEFGITVIDAHAAIADMHNEGYLWWDYVHLTDYGYSALAEIIEKSIGVNYF